MLLWFIKVYKFEALFQYMANLDEIIAVVDEHDEITGKTTRGKVHQEGLLHREVYVFVVSAHHKKVLLQRRADDGKWTTSAGGHFPAEESYLEAGRREFREELGILIPAQFFTELCYERFKTQCNQEVNDRFAKVFAVRKDIPIEAFQIDPQEVSEVRYFDLHGAYSLIKEKTWLTHVAREMLRRYIIHEIV